MINAECTGPALKWSSEPGAAFIGDEDPWRSEMPDPCLLQGLDVGVGRFFWGTAGSHELGANIDNAENCILSVGRLEVEDIRLNGLIETSLLWH